MRDVVRSLLPFLALVHVVACGGRVGGDGGNDPGDSPPDTGTFVPPADGGAEASPPCEGSCGENTVSEAQQACDVDSDCAVVYVGDFCACDPVACLCPNTPVNAALYGIAAPYDAGPFGASGCDCGEPGPVQCVAGLCAFAGSADGGTPISADASGPVTFDAGGPVAVDASNPLSADASAPIEVDDAGGGCVNVSFDLGAPDRSCSADSECVALPSTMVCPGVCQCPDTPVNLAEEARYTAAGGLTVPTCTGCPGTTACLGGQCVYELP